MSRRSTDRFSIEALLADGPLTARELRARMGASPATLARRVADAQGRVLRLGRGKASRYGLVRSPDGMATRLPVYRVDARGEISRAGFVAPLGGGATWVETAASEHLHVGLPPVVVDMAPAGYLGRRFAARYPDLQLPTRLQDWRDEHRWLALARRGDDLAGDLVIGDESMDRLLEHRRRPPESARDRDYPRLAEASAEGGAGSSAAGEQPKFAAIRGDAHVLVKFTSGDGSPSDLRWRDLLACEALALELLASEGIPAARPRVVDVGPRRFLEVERFDRVGRHGRRGLLSLGPLDDDLFGARDSWTQAADRLQAERLLSAEDAHRLRLLDAFGAAIANDDRHFGNVSFYAEGLVDRPQLTLAPVYDMLPMGLAPNAGVVRALPERPPTARAIQIPVWPEASRLAGKYWRLVAKDQRVGPAFRKAAAALARSFS